MSTSWHPLLRRQLQRHAASCANEPELQSFLREVDRAYRQGDADRQLVERSLDLMSQELLESRRDLIAAMRASQVATWSWSSVHDETLLEGYPIPLEPHRQGRARGSAHLLLDGIAPGDRDRLRAALEHSLATGDPLLERVVAAAEGTPRHLELRGMVDVDSNGTRLNGAVLDVTALVEAEHASAKRQDDLRRHGDAVQRLTAELAPLWGDLDACLRVICECGAEGMAVERVSVWLAADDPPRIELRDLFVHSTGAHTNGVSLYAKDHAAYFVALEQARVVAAEDARTHPATSSFREVYLEPLGITSMLDAIARVDGRIAAVVCHEHVGPQRTWNFREHAFAGTLADFVALALEASKRRSAERALDDQRLFLRQVIDLDPNLIFAKDRAGRYTLANRATAELHGTTVDALLGRTADDLGVFPSESKHFQAAEHHVLDTLQEHFTAEEVLTDPRGQKHYLQTTRRPITEPDGSARQVLCVSTDVTARRTAEQEQRRLEEVLRQSQKLESLGMLAGGVAHDFNNLLMPILTCPQLVIDQLPPDSPLVAEMRDVITAGERARDLTAQLLAFGRKQVLELQPLDLDDELQKAHRLLARLVPENIRVELQLGANVRVRADRTQLQQVLINLVVNARDAMRERGGTVRLATGRSTSGGGSGRNVARIHVVDDGSGIDPSHLEHIFEPFFSTKGPGRGTGLGLATVYGIVQQHGGTIAVASRVGEGTTFTIELPAVASVAREERAAKRADLGGTETIVVCEDDTAVRRVVVRQLAQQGYRVLPAANANDALDLVLRSNEAVALVITDVVLPGMSGPELVAQLEREGFRGPFLYMSGHAQDLLAPSGALAPGIRLLRKPFFPNELLQAVRDVLRESRSGPSRLDAGENGEPRA